MEWDFYSGNRIDLDMLDYLPQFTESPEAMAALKQLMDAFPDAKVYGKLPDRMTMGQGESEKTKEFQYGAEIFEEYRRRQEQESRTKVKEGSKKSLDMNQRK